MIGGGILVGIVALVIVAMVVSTARRQRAAVPREPRPGDPSFKLMGPSQPRGQAALVISGATNPGDRVEVEGVEWTVSEIEPVAGDTRAWLVTGGSPDRRKLLDAQVGAVAAALQVRLEEVALAAIATLSPVKYTPDVEDLATHRVAEALRREADLLPEWLVAVGVSCADDLPGDAMPRVLHVGDGYLKCDCAHLAHRIAERHVYG